MPLYINRFRRVRHADPDCRAIRLSEQGLAEAYPDERVRPPARNVVIPDPTDPAEIQALRDFTSPCILCVPGARDSWDALPIVFEANEERDPGMDWTHTAVVTRNEPSPSDPGSVQVVGRAGYGREVVIDDAAPAPYAIGEMVDMTPWDDDEET